MKGACINIYRILLFKFDKTSMHIAFINPLVLLNGLVGMIYYIHVVSKWTGNVYLILYFNKAMRTNIPIAPVSWEGL